MNRRRRTAQAATVVVALVIASGISGGVFRGVRSMPDWRSWERDAGYVWKHGHVPDSTKMFGYLPTTFFALWPFAIWLPKWLGLGLFVGVNVLAAVGSIWFVYRWFRPPGDEPGASFVWPVLLICANFQHVIQADQLTLWILVLCLAGVVWVERGRSVAGGWVLGLAGLIKVMPFLLVGYLVMRRHWKALMGIAVAVVLCDVLPSVAFFGWDGAIAEHRNWLRRTQWYSNSRQIEDPMLIGVYRHKSNFSYPSVLTRWLRGLPDVKRLVVVSGPAPAEEIERCRADLKPDEWLTVNPVPPRDQAWRISKVPLKHTARFHVANFSARAIWWIWVATVGGGLAALAWATWRAGRGPNVAGWPAIAALWMLAMFYITPMMRHYYLALAFPAVAVVWRTLCQYVRHHGCRGAGPVLAIAALAAWGIGVLCLGWDVVRWYGIHLMAATVLAAATVWSWRCARAVETRYAMPV